MTSQAKTVFSTNILFWLRVYIVNVHICGKKRKNRVHQKKTFVLSNYLKKRNAPFYLRFFFFKLGVPIHRKFSVKITIYYQGIPFHSSCLGIIPYCFTKGILKHETNKKLTKKKHNSNLVLSKKNLNKATQRINLPPFGTVTYENHRLLHRNGYAS